MYSLEELSDRVEIPDRLEYVLPRVRPRRLGRSRRDLPAGDDIRLHQRRASPSSLTWAQLKVQPARRSADPVRSARLHQQLHRIRRRPEHRRRPDEGLQPAVRPRTRRPAAHLRRTRGIPRRVAANGRRLAGVHADSGPAGTTPATTRTTVRCRTPVRRPSSRSPEANNTTSEPIGRRRQELGGDGRSTTFEQRQLQEAGTQRIADDRHIVGGDELVSQIAQQARCCRPSRRGRPARPAPDCRTTTGSVRRVVGSRRPGYRR